MARARQRVGASRARARARIRAGEGASAAAPRARARDGRASIAANAGSLDAAAAAAAGAAAAGAGAFAAAAGAAAFFVAAFGFLSAWPFSPFDRPRDSRTNGKKSILPGMYCCNTSGTRTPSSVWYVWRRAIAHPGGAKPMLTPRRVDRTRERDARPHTSSKQQMTRPVAQSVAFSKWQ